MGNSVDMGFFEMLIYILIPFATIFMRIFRLNGSLDKLWLFLFYIKKEYLGQQSMECLKKYFLPFQNLCIFIID